MGLGHASHPDARHPEIGDRDGGGRGVDGLAHLQLTLGLLLLFGGGEVLIRGSVSLADRWGVSPLLIGATVVAFGTSTPELAVCLNAALTGHASLALGNVVGSNIANVLLIVGLAGLVFPITWTPHKLRRDATALVITTGLFVLFATTGQIVAWAGGLMVAILLALTLLSYQMERRDNHGSATLEMLSREAEEMQRGPHLGAALVGTMAGLVAVIVGADQLVEGASALALTAGISEATIGLTLVALGTSLPELATALVAAYRKHSELAIGNVVGSNVFNLLGIAGTTAMVAPLSVPQEILDLDLWLMTGLTVAFALTLVGWSRVGRGPALVFVVVYVTWVSFKL